MINNVFIFAAALFLVIQGAAIATKYGAQLAKSYHLSKYTIGFIVVAVISILPEAFISLNSAFAGVPSFGLGMLMGSNIADLTLIFAIIIWVTGRGIKIEGSILKNNRAYPLLLLIPTMMGLDGYFSRVDGAVLVTMGFIFYYLAFQNDTSGPMLVKNTEGRLKNSLLLIAGMVLLLIGSHFTVTSATSLAHIMGLNPILIGMLIVGLGTTLPELFFSLHAVKKRDDALAVGDILGTVLADITIVLGMLALVSPFFFPQKIIYVTGGFMIGAAVLLMVFMRSGKVISKKESYILFLYWLAFVCVEMITAMYA